MMYVLTQEEKDQLVPRDRLDSQTARANALVNVVQRLMRRGDEEGAPEWECPHDGGYVCDECPLIVTPDGKHRRFIGTGGARVELCHLDKEFSK